MSMRNHTGTTLGRIGFLKQTKQISSHIEYEDYEFLMKYGGQNVSAGLRKVISDIKRISKNNPNLLKI